MTTTRWRICVTMATLFYIFNSTVIDWTCYVFFLGGDMTQHWLVNNYRRSVECSCLHRLQLHRPWRQRLQPPSNVVNLHQLTWHYIPEGPHLQLFMYNVDSLVWCYNNGQNFMISSKYCIFSDLLETTSRERLSTRRHPSLYEHTSYEKQRFILFFQTRNKFSCLQRKRSNIQRRAKRINWMFY